MKKDKLKAKIFALNKAYHKIREGIKILDNFYKDNKDVNYYYWKLNKINDQLNKKILKLLKKEQLNKNWEKLVIKLKEKTNE